MNDNNPFEPRPRRRRDIVPAAIVYGCLALVIIFLLSVMATTLR